MLVNHEEGRPRRQRETLMRCKSDLLKKRGGRKEDEQCGYKKFGRLVEMCLFQCYPWGMASLPGMSLHQLTGVAQSLARNSLWEHGLA